MTHMDIDDRALPIINEAELFLDKVRQCVSTVFHDIEPIFLEFPDDSIQDWDKAPLVKKWNNTLSSGIPGDCALLYAIARPKVHGFCPLYIGQTTTGRGRILEHLYRITPLWRTKALQVHSRVYLGERLGISFLAFPDKISSLILTLEKVARDIYKPAWNNDDTVDLDINYLHYRKDVYQKELDSLEKEMTKTSSLSFLDRGTRKDRMENLKELIIFLNARIQLISSEYPKND